MDGTVESRGGTRSPSATVSGGVLSHYVAEYLPGSWRETTKKPGMMRERTIMRLSE
jgi:hypothetical protein